MFNRNVAIDKDDTLNWLTKDICEEAGIPVEEIPTLDVIKTGRATPEFYKAREAFFANPENFANAPYGLAHKIVSMAEEAGLNPLICTKTMSNHPRGGEIVMHKFDFLRKHFPETEAQIVVGRKFPDAIAMVDDSYNNCLQFNKTGYRPFLVWNHQIATEETLKHFYTYVNFFDQAIKESPKLLSQEARTHLIRADYSGDFPYCEIQQCSVDEQDVFLGYFIVPQNASTRFCKIYVESKIFNMDKKELLEMLNNTMGEDCYFSNEEEEAFTKVSLYNLQSKIFS